jgi:hypothetical protein
MMIDATIVRAHQHSAGARKKTASKRSAVSVVVIPPSSTLGDERLFDL